MRVIVLLKTTKPDVQYIYICTYIYVYKFLVEQFARQGKRALQKRLILKGESDNGIGWQRCVGSLKM